MWNSNILSNFTMETVNVPANDKGKGFQIGQASTKPRMILGASAVSVSNSTNVTPVLAMVPGRQLTSGIFDSNTSPCVYLAQSSKAMTTGLASTFEPACVIPYIETRAGGGPFPILPPGWLLIAITGSVDADGVIQWQICSCDLG